MDGEEEKGENGHTFAKMEGKRDGGREAEESCKRDTRAHKSVHVLGVEMI